MDPRGKKREAAKALFAPEQYLTTTGDACINQKMSLTTMRITRNPLMWIRMSQRYNGALVVVGSVMDINHEGKETQWDSRQSYLSISNQVLQENLF